MLSYHFMNKIKLTQGKYAIVDDEDFEYLSQWKWYSSHNYAARKYCFPRINGKQKTKIIYMHRIINNTPNGFETDHVNRNTFDNRRCNLRTVTKSQNQFNTNKWKSNTSGVKGVYWRKDRNKYQAQIMINKKLVKLGCYLTLKEATLARRKGEQLYHAI